MKPYALSEIIWCRNFWAESDVKRLSQADMNGWKIKQLLMQIGDRMKTLEWIDNADSWICPICRTEVWSPAAYNYHCPGCGFIAERDKNKFSIFQEEKR